MARIDPSPSLRTGIIKEAADLLGTNPLADALGVSRRSVAYWQDDASGRAMPEAVLRPLLPLIDAHIERARQLRRAVFTEICAGLDKSPKETSLG